MAVPSEMPTNVRRRLIFFSTAALLILSACSVAGLAPTDDEASGVLDRLVALAAAGDFDGLCSIGDLNCTQTLADVGVESAPSERPNVLRTRVIDADPAIGAVGGRVLTLCGIDGLGQEYQSEVLVFRDGATLRVINPIFWSGTSIADDATSPASPRSDESCPPRQ
jgi:hypothetical protein